MKKHEEASKIFKEGLNCSQAVFATYSEEFGLDKSSVLKIASGFGGGIGQSGETCGVVTGAFMVLGLKFGSDSVTPDPESKKLPMDKIKLFREKFIDLYGSTNCKDLLGYDLADPGDSATVSEKKLTKEICPKYIEAACRLLEEMI